IGFITDGQNQSTDQSIELDVAAATAAYLNEHRGGIAGRPIELVTCEAMLDPAVGTDCANQMVEEGVPVVAVGTTGVVESVWNPLHDAGVPTMFYAGSGDTVLADTETTFSISNPIVGNILLPLDAAEQNDLDKVTVVVIDVPAALAGYEGEDAALFEDAGIELELVQVPPGTADMTPLLQPVVAGDPGVVHVLGNDSFCISAYQALQTLSFDGPITSITQCVTDATRQAVGGSLEGITIASPAPVGVEDESTELYRTVMDTFSSEEIDTSRIAGVGTFLVLNALDVALEGLEGEVTPEAVITTIKAMPESELPGGGGLTFRCDGSALQGRPAVCTDAGLTTTLDAEGFPTRFELTTADG
ncbi:MAG TPA: ABC transporter substrate-binding protein, partial [Acidimicrobiales bacterium]|nr:ABC transporter substrate-binding protein [Acidimicrobiales bacterium]